RLDGAIRRAPVAVNPIAIVALLTRLEDPVSARNPNLERVVFAIGRRIGPNLAYRQNIHSAGIVRIVVGEELYDPTTVRARALRVTAEIARNLVVGHVKRSVRSGVAIARVARRPACRRIAQISSSAIHEAAILSPWHEHREKVISIG